MTQFDRNKFRQAGMWVYYDSKFVGRFKYQKSAIGSFIKFLRANFTVEEYFDRIEAGENPLTIVSEKGFLLPSMKKFLRDRGYDDTKEGYEQYRFDINRSSR